MKISYEDPLVHLLASFTQEQQELWDLHKEGKRIKIVLVSKILSQKELGKNLMKSWKEKY